MTSIKYKLSGETIWKVVQIDFQISRRIPPCLFQAAVFESLLEALCRLNTSTQIVRVRHIFVCIKI